MLHAWEIIDGEFKVYQDQEADRRAKSGNRTSSDGQTADDWEDEDSAPRQRAEVDTAGFPKLKHNYASVT